MQISDEYGLQLEQAIILLWLGYLPVFIDKQRTSLIPVLVISSLLIVKKEEREGQVSLLAVHAPLGIVEKDVHYVDLLTKKILFC